MERMASQGSSKSNYAKSAKGVKNAKKELEGLKKI